MNESLLKVSHGIRLVFIGLTTVFAALILGFLGACVAGAGAGAMAKGGAGGPAPGAVGAVIAVLVLVGLVYIAGLIISLVGKLYCIAIPAEVGAAKSLITTAVGLEVLSVALAGVDLLASFKPDLLPPVVVGVAKLINILAAITAVILFLLFLKNVARYIRKPKIAKSAMTVLNLWILCGVLYLGGAGIMVAGLLGGAAAGGNGAGGIAMLGACPMLIAAILALVNIILYSRLLLALSRATKEYVLNRNEYGDEPDNDYDDRYDRRDGFDDRRDEPPATGGWRDDDDDDGDKPWRR